MMPVNQSAKEISREIHCVAHSGIGLPIDWAHGTAIVIDNWMVLHGRGASPANEGARVLERIYVRAQ
jgi:alpha-ketoglutarate-dependent taurine dioxygenase